MPARSMQWKSGVVAIAVVLYVSRVEAYTWPNPVLEELDGQLYDRDGYNSRPLATGMQPGQPGTLPNCNFFLFDATAGRSNAADWIRTVRVIIPSFQEEHSR